MGKLFKKFENIDESVVELVIAESLADLAVTEPALIESIEVFCEKCLEGSNKSCRELSESLSAVLGPHFIDNAAYWVGVMIEAEEIPGDLLHEMADQYGDAKVFKTAVAYQMAKGKKAMPSNPDFKSGAGALVYNTLSQTYFTPNSGTQAGSM